MFTERTSVGLDVHARSVAAAAIDGVTGELFQTKLTPAHDHIGSWLQGLPGPVAVAYEAGPTGFGLHRHLSATGIRCEVVAPSKLQKPAGDRVKTDAKDAIHLARLLRLDEITPVAIPTVDQEAARDLVRAREDCRGDLMRARHRLSKLLLRHGIVYYGGNAWTGKHDQWLRTEALPQQGSITKTGNGHARRLLVEAAWHHRPRYTIGATMRARWDLAPAAARARGDEGNRRLHHRWVTFIDRRKRSTIADVAIARELAGWCWSLAMIED